jgi:predicted nucleic acid-binding Zn ribbon protein
MNQRNSNLTPLKDILGALLNNSSLPFNPDDGQIWQIWAETVGPAIARNASPLWIKKGWLRVKVSDPIWLQELSLAGEAIKEKLNGKLGRRAVEKIEFRLRSR